MSRSPMRRVAAATAAGALVLGGATVALGLGTGVAGAQEAPACLQSVTATKDGVLADHTYTRSVTPGETASGETVTYKTLISSTATIPQGVTSIKEVPPTGFAAPLTSKVSALNVLGGQIVTNDVPAVPDGSGYKVTVANPGWLVGTSGPVIWETTYEVPEGIGSGNKTDGGIVVTDNLVSDIDNNLPGLSTCFTVRGNNLGEATLGSLDSAGLGSAEGQLSSTVVISDIISDALIDVIGSGALEGVAS